MHRSEAVSLCHPVVPVFDGMAMITRDELLYPVAPPEPQQPVTDPAGESGPGTGAQIAEGAALVEKALCSRRFGPYTLQAVIAAVHAEAESTTATDWRQIVALYNQLVRLQPAPVVHLNRAVGIAMRDGQEAGLKHIDAVLEHGELANYYAAHSAQKCTAG
jgi:hypothetical protein